MTDHLRVGEPEHGVRYSTESEKAFDDAIWWGNLERAHEISGKLHDAVDEYVTVGTLPEDAPRILTKELAMPMYIRIESDAGNIRYTDAEYDISALYGESIALLQYYLEWLTALKGRLLDERGKRLQRHLVGAASEVTIFGLTARQLYGTDDDPYTIIPSNFLEDLGTIDPETGLRSGFDFTLTNRSTSEALLLQVKTKRQKGEFEKGYIKDITIVDVSRIAGGALQITPLQEAMVAEVNGKATMEQIDRINKAIEKFNRLISHRLGQAALQATA